MLITVNQPIERIYVSAMLKTTRNGNKIALFKGFRVLFILRDYCVQRSMYIQGHN